MKLYKSLIITVLCLVAFAAQAQSSQQFIDIKCQELASDEARAELELKRIRNERAKLNASKVELQINLYNKQLTDLELEKARRISDIETDYLRRKGEILSKMTVATSVQTSPQCVSN